MPIIRALVTLPATSALAEDAATNTLHFSAPGVNLTDEINLIHGNLTTFYQAIDTYLSPKLSTTANVKYYDLDDPKPRPPKSEQTMGLAAFPGTALASELAVCLSYQAARVAGSDQAHRRGRIYLGPLNSSAAGTTTASDRPASSMLTAIGVAATALATDSFADGVPWHVYSPTLLSSAPVTDGWIDNAFDVQRRRGVQATSRTLWT